MLPTLLAIPRNHPIKIRRPVAGGQVNGNFLIQALYFVAAQAAEVEMIVAVVVGFTLGANGEVLLTIVGYDTVYQAIIAKTVEDTVDGGPVCLGGDLLLDHVVAQGGIGFL